MKVDSRYFWSSSSHTSEGGVAPSSSSKLLAGCLHIDFCNHLSTKNRYYKPCKLPDLSRITQCSISKSGHVTSNAIENYELLCDFWKRIQVRKHYKLTTNTSQAAWFVYRILDSYFIWLKKGRNRNLKFYAHKSSSLTCIGIKQYCELPSLLLLVYAVFFTITSQSLLKFTIFSFP